MKNLMKVLSLVLVLMLVIAPATSFAMSAFMNQNAGNTGGQIGAGVSEIGGTIYGIFRTVAIVIGSCMVLYMAIQWILATPAKKAELKGRMVSLAIGVVLLFGGATVLTFVENAAKAL